MDIVIHTYGRPDWSRQHTAQQLMRDKIAFKFVIQHREAEAYAQRAAYDDCEFLVLPDNIRQLSPTRDWLIHEAKGDDHIVFLDDDLHFAVRRSDDPTKFRQPQPGDLRDMFSAIDRALKVFPMVGIGAREGGNRVTEDRVYNTRLMRVLAFRRSYLRNNHITFSPLVVMEDFHVNLQILRSGADTVALNRWVSNQAEGSNAPGGCSEYRTQNVQTEAAYALAARHPGFVRVVKKPGWRGQPERTDVIVSWKKARASAEALK